MHELKAFGRARPDGANDVGDPVGRCPGVPSVSSRPVRRATVVRLMGDNRPPAIVAATGFGMASSSYSYAGVALARSLFRKSASFPGVMAFEIASTNLVIELGVIIFCCLAGHSPWPSSSAARPSSCSPRSGARSSARS